MLKIPVFDNASKFLGQIIFSSAGLLSGVRMLLNYSVRI